MMSEKCTSPEGHKFRITNDCQTIMCWCERCEYSTLEAEDVEAMLNEHAALKREKEQKPDIKISDGDVWLVFPDVMLSIEGICKFGTPGPIVKRNLRKWRDALLESEGEDDE